MTYLSVDNTPKNNQDELKYRIIGNVDLKKIPGELDPSIDEVFPFAVVSRVPPEIRKDRRIFTKAPVSVDIIPMPRLRVRSDKGCVIHLVQEALQCFANHNSLSDVDISFVRYLNNCTKNPFDNSDGYRVGTSSIVFSVFGLGANLADRGDGDLRCYSWNAAELFKDSGCATGLDRLLKYHYYRSSTKLCRLALQGLDFPLKRLSHYDQEYSFKRSRDGTWQIVALDAWSVSNQGIILPSALGALDCFIVPPCFHWKSRAQYSFLPRAFSGVAINVDIDYSGVRFIPAIYAFRLGLRMISAVVLYPRLEDQTSGLKEPRIVFATSHKISSLIVNSSRDLEAPNVVLKCRSYSSGQQVEDTVRLWVDVSDRVVRKVAFEEGSKLYIYKDPCGIPATLSYPVDYLLMTYVLNQSNIRRFVTNINVDTEWPGLLNL